MKKNPLLLWILCSSVLCFLLGTLFHFLYQWFPSLVFQVLFPINESIWEHLKLCFYPVILLWLLPQQKIPLFSSLAWSKEQRINGMTISAVISMLVTFFGYYGLRYGLAIESLPIDLLLYFVSLVLGQYHGILITKSKRAAEYSQCAIYILIIIAVLFMLFSLAPLALPAFAPPEAH